MAVESTQPGTWPPTPLFSIDARGPGIVVAATFAASDPNNGGAALAGTTAGLGSAAVFAVSNPANQNVALWSQTDGGGPAIGAWNTGTGAAGVFSINNVNSDAPALYATTNGTGWAAQFDGRGYFGGAVGINTTEPDLALHVFGDGVEGIKIEVPDGPANRAILEFSAGADGAFDHGGCIQLTAPSLASAPNTLQLVNHVDGPIALLAPRIGVGTSTPSAKLALGGVSPAQAFGQSAVFIEQDNTYFDYSTGMVLRGEGPVWNTRITATDFIDPGGEVLGVYRAEVVPGDVVNGAGMPIAVFKNDGRVGVGTTDPQAALEIAVAGGPENTSLVVAGLGRFDDSLQVGHNIHGGSNNELSLISTLPNEDNPSSIRFSTSDGSGQTERMRVSADGSVGIGTPDPEYRLDVNGVIRTTGGIRFPDGSEQTSAATSSPPPQLGPRGVQEFPTPGYHEWIAPVGVHRVMLELWGASGGGGGGGGGGYSPWNGDPNIPYVPGGGGGGGGGGGAGAYVKIVVEVTPGTTYVLRIGVGGAGGSGGGVGSGGQNGDGGTTSQFLEEDDALLAEALPGAGGHGGTDASGPANGAGGTGGIGATIGAMSGIIRNGADGRNGGSTTLVISPGAGGLGACGSVSLPSATNPAYSFIWPGAAGGTGGLGGPGQAYSSGPYAGLEGQPGTDGYAVLQW